MAKTYLPAGGGLTFKSVLRFVGPSPLDGRGVVDTLSNISGQAYKTTFGGSEFEDVDSFYEGMLVVTKDTGKLYVLNGGTFKEVTPDLSGIQSTLDAIPTTYVPQTRTINNKALSSDIRITKSDIGLSDVDNLAASGYLTALISDTTNAIQITVGGTTKEITVAALKTSLGLGSLAYRDSLSFQDVGALSATGTAEKAKALALTQAVGDTKTPVYFNAEGKPIALSYTIEKSVPANAVFTDTTYTFGDGFTTSGTTITPTLNSTSSLGTIGSDKVYAVGLDSNKKLAVKVDWTDEKVNVSALAAPGASATKHYITTVTGAGNSSLDIDTNNNIGVYIQRDAEGSTLFSPIFRGALKGNADIATKATTATSLENAPTIQSDSTYPTKVTITAGGKTSDSFTVPYATRAETSIVEEVVFNIVQSDNNFTSQEYSFDLPTVVGTHVVQLPDQILGEGSFGIRLGSESSYVIKNVKSNGFTIPGQTVSEGWDSTVTLAAGTLENIEITVQHIF